MHHANNVPASYIYNIIIYLMIQYYIHIIIAFYNALPILPFNNIYFISLERYTIQRSEKLALEIEKETRKIFTDNKIAEKKEK